MQLSQSASADDLLDAIALARVVLPAEISVQTPPNLVNDLAGAIASGINDLGGVSPITIDFINPERPWPIIEHLAGQCRELGFELHPRLPLYPRYLTDPRFVSAAVRA